jgi:putative membrane protein
MLISAAGLALAAFLVPGIELEGTGTLLAAALLLGIVNAVLRPLVIFFTIPLTLATLGLFLLVINAGMFAFVAWLLSGFSVSGFSSALAGSLIVSFTSWLASWYIGPSGRVQVLIVREE